MLVSRAVVLLGSNIDSQTNLCRAVRRLSAVVRVLALSPVYESEPKGGERQPCFLNAAALIETHQSPEELKETLARIERELGRVRTADKNAPRTIDLDIVLYDDKIGEVKGHRIPDPDLLLYPHVAKPVADIVPDLLHPETGVALKKIVEGLSLERLRLRPEIDLAACL